MDREGAAGRVGRVERMRGRSKSKEVDSGSPPGAKKWRGVAISRSAVAEVATDGYRDVSTCSRLQRYLLGLAASSDSGIP